MRRSFRFISVSSKYPHMYIHIYYMYVYIIYMSGISHMSEVTCFTPKYSSGSFFSADSIYGGLFFCWCFYFRLEHTLCNSLSRQTYLSILFTVDNKFNYAQRNENENKARKRIILSVSFVVK